MKLENQNENIPQVESTEIGYSTKEFRKMITDAKASGYSKVTADGIKANARKRHGLTSK